MPSTSRRNDEAYLADTTPMYATFSEDMSGFYGKWTTTMHAPYLKKLGTSPVREYSGRDLTITTSPVREPKWTDETDEEDEYMFSDRDETPMKPRMSKRARSLRQVRSSGNAARLVARSFKKQTSRAARGLVGLLSNRSSIFDFKMFKLFTFVLNVTLSTFEIPRQMVLIPLLVGSRFRIVPEWVVSLFEMAEEVDAPKRSQEEVFPPLRWKALKVWENAVRSGRDRKLQRAESVGQVEQPETTALVDKLVEEGMAFDKACDSVASQRAFEEALKLRPKDPAILCALSKELSDRVFDHEIFHNKPMARKFASDASDLANKAISIAPTDAQCYIAFAVANARLSMFSEVRQRVELTHAIKDNLLKAIELDPDNDYAYHVLARFEHTMAHVSGLVRYLVKKLYGAMEPATIERAEEYFRKAIDINPQRLIHGVELAKLLYETKRYDECKTLLLRALELEIEDINSLRTKKDGEALLSKLTNKLNRTPSRRSMSHTPSRSKLPRTSSTHSVGSPLKSPSRQNSLVFSSS